MNNKLNLLTPREYDRHMQTQLKLLRLSGVLETLDVRVKQAMAPQRATFDEQMSYVDFLQRLLEDEKVALRGAIERRTQRQLAMRVRRANPRQPGAGAFKPTKRLMAPRTATYDLTLPLTRNSTNN